MAITKLKALGVTANTITASQIANDTITNTQINSSAAIAFSKLTGVTNGITEADEWRVPSSQAGGNGIITTWERNDTEFEKIGTGMSESSGIFSFPNTGKWLINFHLYVSATSFSRYNDMYIQTTVNNSNYNTRAYHSFPVPWASSHMHTGGTTSFQFDVTNVSTHKVKFMFNPETTSTMTIRGSSTGCNSYVQFLQLAET